MWFPFVSILLILVLIVDIIYCTGKGKIREEERRKKNEYHQLNYEHFYAGMDAKKPETVQKHLEVLEEGYSEISHCMSKSDRKCYQEDIEELREYMCDLEEDEWRGKADSTLEKFLSIYRLIMESDFRDVEKAQRSLNQCLKYYDSYWEITRKQSDESGNPSVQKRLWDEAREHFISSFGTDKGIMFWGSGCNLSPREQIHQQLSLRIEQMRPEYKRKMRIFDDILALVAEKKSIPRSNLLSSELNNATPQEISCCYKALLKANRIVQVKLGNCYFVSLSDSEAAAQGKKISNKERQEEKASAPQREEDILSMLQEKNIVYIDKRKIGGCLWVESSDANDAFISSIDIGGKKFRKVNNARTFNGAAGWFIK